MHTVDNGKSPDDRLEGGELYLFLDDRNQNYRFAKVLAAFPDVGVAFIRTYKQRFAEPPDQVNVSALTVGSLDDREGPTIGCAPVRYQSIHDDWRSSPDYGFSELSDEEIDAVNEIIAMMNAPGDGEDA